MECARAVASVMRSRATGLEIGVMNFRRLQYFVKIVDVGSLTQAADMLHVAQPALSQQLATLEGEVRQQLLVRTKRGVTPTEAGKVLYRHAQLILRQCEQARVDMNAAARRSVWRRIGGTRAGYGRGGTGACRCCGRCARVIRACCSTSTKPTAPRCPSSS